MNSAQSPALPLKSLTRYACLALGVATLAVSSHATVIDWDGDTSITWATASNWGGGVAPVNNLTTDIARFNLAAYGGNPVFAPSAGTTSIAGIEIGASNGAMALTATNLSIGASGITMELGAAATSIGRVTSGAAQIWTNNSANTLTMAGGNVFTNQVTLAGSGTFTFGNAAGSGAGGVRIDGATVQMRGANLGTGTITLNSGWVILIANATTNNTLSITGDMKFGSLTTSNGAFGGLTSTTGDRVLTFQTGASAAAGNTNVRFDTNALVLGGNLEITNLLGGDNGLRGINANFNGGLDLNGANRTLTLSQTTTSGSTTFGLLTLSGNLLVNGSGVQNTALNGGFATNGVARTITFNNAGTGAPTLSGSLAGTASTVTIAGSSTNAIIGGSGLGLTGATAHAIELNSSTGGNFTFSGPSTFTGGFTLTDGIARVATAGVAATSGALGTGATVVNGGRLESNLASALLGSSAITVNNGELRATVADSLITNAIPITLNGGTLRGFNAGTTIAYGGGAINVTSNSTIVNERSGAPSATSNFMTFGTSVAVGSSQLSVTSTDNQTGGNSTVTLGNATLTGNGILNVTDNPAATNNTILALTTLTATGTGNQIANSNGVVSVSGLTTIGGASAGTLRVNGALTATGGVTVATNGTFGGSGTTTGTVTTSTTTSVITPGNTGAGTMSVTGAVNADLGANFKFDLGATSGGGVSDLLAMTGIFTGSTAANGLIFDFTNIGTTAATPYTLLTFASSTGLARSDILVNTAPSGFMLDSSFGSNGFLINGTDLQVQFTVVPEPSTYALLVVGLGLAIWVRRRGRKNAMLA